MGIEIPYPGLSDSIDRVSSEFVLQLEEQTTRLESNVAKLTDLKALDGVVGDLAVPGTMRMAIHHGHIYGTGGPHGVLSKGDFPTVNLGSTDQVYVHYKLPLNIYRDICMFWFRVRGYNYGGSAVVDETFVGYCYADGRSLQAVHTQGRFTPAVYADAAGNVVLRLYFPLVYYTALSMDTMQCGTTHWMRLLKKEDIVVALSKSAILNFG